MLPKDGMSAINNSINNARAARLLGRDLEMLTCPSLRIAALTSGPKTRYSCKYKENAAGHQAQVFATGKGTPGRRVGDVRKDRLVCEISLSGIINTFNSRSCRSPAFFLSHFRTHCHRRLCIVLV